MLRETLGESCTSSWRSSDERRERSDVPREQQDGAQMRRRYLGDLRGMRRSLKRVPERQRGDERQVRLPQRVWRAVIPATRHVIPEQQEHSRRRVAAIARTRQRTQMQCSHHVAMWKHRDQACQPGPNRLRRIDTGSEDQRTSQWLTQAETSDTAAQHSDACKWKKKYRSFIPCEHCRVPFPDGKEQSTW